MTIGANRTGTHVQELDGKTLAVKAHHGGPTRSAILHISHISVIFQQHMTTTESQKEQKMSLINIVNPYSIESMEKYEKIRVINN